MVKLVSGVNTAPIYIPPQQGDVDRLIETSKETLNIAKDYNDAFNTVNDQFGQLASMVEELQQGLHSQEEIDAQKAKEKEEDELELLEEQEFARKKAEYELQGIQHKERSKALDLEIQKLKTVNDQKAEELKNKKDDPVVVYIKKDKEKTKLPIIQHPPQPQSLSFCSRFWSWVKSFWK